MAALVVDPKSIHAFATDTALTRWFKSHHDKERELYLRIYKKDSGEQTVTYREALDVALCFGWIDGVRKAYDAQSFLQRFTPRNPKSIWSQINREHVARLISTGRMTPHGLAQVDAAKADGRWDAAYAGSRTMEPPRDLLDAIAKNRAAQATFDRLDRKNRYALAFRLANLKTQAGREKKIATFVAMLASGETLHPQKTEK